MFRHNLCSCSIFVSQAEHNMDLQGKKKIRYKREKGKVELSGSGNNIKWQIWFDLVSSRLIVILIILVILFSSKEGLAILLFKYLQKMVFP